MKRENSKTFRGKERVRKREDLQRLFKSGSRYYSKQYTLILVRNDLDYLRLVVSIKKNIGNAVVRNYEKRLCRELFRREKGTLEKGYDVLVIVRETTRNFHESYTMLKKLFYQYLS